MNIPSTRFSSGVMVAHFIPTLYFLMALAASTVTENSLTFEHLHNPMKHDQKHDQKHSDAAK